jgi:hypothetical protein
MSTRLYILFALVSLALAAPLSADNGEPAGAEGKTAKTTKSGKAPTAARLAPEREAAVLAFVKNNHPQLSELLIYLREKQPKQYERAVRDLFRTTERLAKIHDQDRDRYKLELKAWQVKSRIQLIAARLRMSPDDDQLQGELRQALAEDARNRQALLEGQRKKFAEKVESLDAAIDNLKANRNAMIDAEFKRITATGKKPTPKPAAQPTTKSKK